MATLGSLTASMELNSTSFTRGIDQANAAARNFGRGMQSQTAGVGKSFQTMEQSSRQALRGLSAGLAPISPALSGVARDASFAKTHVAALGAVAATAAVALVGVGVALTTKVVAAGKTLETDLARLNAVIKTTGSSAGLTATQIREFADELASQTLADAPAVRAAATKLLTFRNIAGDTFTETLVLAQDLAAVGFGSIETASVQLGKALEDPVAGVSALKEAGISFSQSQRDVIKSLVETNQLAQAQALVLEQVRVQVGGAGAAAGGGLAGAFDALGGNILKFVERTSEATGATNILERAIGGLATAIETLGDRIAPSLEAAQAQLDALLDRRAQLLERVQTGAGPAADAGLVNVEAAIEAQRALVASLLDVASARQVEEAATARASKEVQASLQAEREVAGVVTGTATVVDEAAAAWARYQAEMQALAQTRTEFIDGLNVEVEQLGRMLDATRAGEDAARGMATAIAVENEVRRLGLSLYSEEGRRVSRLIGERAALRGEIDATADARKDEVAAAQAAQRELDAIVARQHEETIMRPIRTGAEGLAAEHADALEQALS